MVCGLTGFVFLTWFEAHRKYFFCFEITQLSFPPGCRELTGSCSGTRGTIVGTMNTACPKSWPVHPAGTGAVWVRSTHFCTTGPLCRLCRPWSSSNQSMCLSRSLSILLCTFPLFFIALAHFKHMTHLMCHFCRMIFFCCSAVRSIVFDHFIGLMTCFIAVLLLRGS